ncbi:MAG TPA: phenylacetic acid degradation protein PaaN [Acidimicrobiia bacterium]|jgi:phenylacetic acid degradation protein paaN|nr:phenylacetic acid degradation protein PaaN [Acidimicrobiia bacterium]
MATDFYAQHEETLDTALETIRTRRYWSPYPESPRAYGEDAPAAGEAAFQSRLGKPFELDQPGDGFMSAAETSPYGIELGVTYPRATVDGLLDAGELAMPAWAAASPDVRAGVCLEILARLGKQSFEMAHAVMHTTGQAFLMAFQAGGPHALDRGLEGLAYAYAEMTRLPTTMRWEKPQGKRDPLVIDKTWRIKPRGIAATIGVSTFPTWNGYPGIVASLVTGNPVVIKPHPGTILPLALFVETARAVAAEAGFDPNLVTLLVDTPDAPVAKDLVMDPRVKLVDYTGGSGFGTWLEEHVNHALVFTEKAGVNSVIIDSAADLKGVFRNLSVSMTMYSGQMCTTPQNVYIPRAGITVGGEHASFDEVAMGLAAAIQGLLSDDQRAGDILGAIKGEATLQRLDAAAGDGVALLESREVKNATFPNAVVRTPIIVQVDGADRATYMREMFGPVAYIIATGGTEESLALATESAQQHGAITWLVYSVDDDVIEAAEAAAVDAGVSVAFNLTGGLYVNQSAAFSDFHVTGANPAGNASLTDPAFVAGRFRIVGVRKPA